MKLTEKQKNELLEKLSQLEHEQWMKWAKHILENENISEETRKKWEEDFIPYSELPENIKKLDRPFAQKSLEIFEDFLSSFGL